MQFPHYQQLADSLAARDSAILFIWLSVVIVLFWVGLVRWLYPRYLPVLCNTALFVFYVTISLFLFWRFR
jgi:hypothetical protein